MFYGRNLLGRQTKHRNMENIEEISGMKMYDNPLTPYLLINGKHILKDFWQKIGNITWEKQEAGVEKNEIEIDNFNLDIKLVKMTIKSLKSNT